MKAQFIKTSILSFALFLLVITMIWSCSNDKTDYRDLKWEYITESATSLSISISDSIVTAYGILYTAKDSIGNENDVTDSTSAKILSWKDGLIILDEKCENLIDDTLFYEVYSTENKSYLLLSVIKLIPTEGKPALRMPITMALTNEQNEIVKATDFWRPLDLEFEGYKCGDSIAWDNLDYFGYEADVFYVYGEYNLRKDQTIAISPSNGIILQIVKKNIPFSEVSSYVNKINSILGISAKNHSTHDDYPFYTWYNGFTTIYLYQDLNWIEGSGTKAEYKLTINDLEVEALSSIDALKTEEDKNQRLVKKKVMDIFQRTGMKQNEFEIYSSLDSAIQIDPNCYLAYYLKAEYKYGFQNISGAKVDCEKAYELNEYHQPTLELLLLIYLTEGNNYDAKTLVQTSEKWINSTANSAALLGEYYRIVEQNLDKACKYYNIAYDRGFIEVLPTIKQICQ